MSKYDFDAHTRNFYLCPFCTTPTELTDISVWYNALAEKEGMAFGSAQHRRFIKERNIRPHNTMREFYGQPPINYD